MEHASKSNKFFKEFMKHLDSLYNYALWLTNSESKAEELLRNTYRKAYLQSDECKNNTNIRLWLFDMMSNSGKHDLPKANNAAPLPHRIESGKILELMDSSPQEVDEHVLETLSSLPEYHRTIIFLRDVEEFSYEEMAEFFSISVETLRSHLRSARRALGLKLIQLADNN